MTKSWGKVGENGENSGVKEKRAKINSIDNPRNFEQTNAQQLSLVCSERSKGSKYPF